MSKPPREYLASIGRKGGQAGKGGAKRRPPEHYRRMAEIRAANRAQQPERSTTE
jgi:hypothetical protein